MDEGFTQYSETRVMDAVYGEKSGAVDVAGIRIGDSEMARDGYVNMSNPKAAPIDTFAWAFPSGSYGSITYSKTATWMITLERIIGRTAMDEAMRTYFQRWKFRHPGRADFEAVVNEVVRKHHGNRFGASMDWFFTQMLDGTEMCDYAVKGVSSRRVAPPRGRDVDTVGFGSRPRLYETTVSVHRLGEVMLPVDILVTFSDGYAELVVWDGKERVKVLTFVREHEVVAATADPQRKLWVDKDFSNNARSTEVDSAAIWKYTIKALYWLQNVVQYAAIF
jgi:hypothetical protein